MDGEILDVLIIGAGVSGIAMACTIKARCPAKRFAILERRRRLGGTWDLFRYPGARSDSDMHSYAFGFRPWQSPSVLGEAGAIRDYLEQTTREHGIDGAIRYGLRVRAASWSSAEQCWTVRTETEGGDAGSPTQTLRARFLVLGTGYYDHDGGYRPQWPGLEGFAGRLVHPQHWPQDLDTRGQRVVVIGSGATAISLVPALAGRAASVTMLQRSPSWLLSVPTQDHLGPLLAKLMPQRLALAAVRRFNVGFANLLYRACRRWPDAMGKLLRRHVQARIGPEADLRDFTPRYAPWEQRLCIVADGDFFAALRSGRLQVVTDEIERFERDAIRLRSGRTLPADIVVTATGLQLQALGGIEIDVDGRPWRTGDHMLYRGVLPEGLPNAAGVLGYINASWTLKAELAAAYVCRLLNHLDAHGLATVVAQDQEGCRTGDHVMSALSAGYVQRAAAELPRQGSRAPWRVTHDLRVDRKLLLEQAIDDGVLRFEAARTGTHQVGAAATTT